MAWRTDITVLLFVVIALTKGNLNVIGEWNLYGSLTPNHNTAQPQGRYFINHVKAAAPPTVPPRRDRTNARLSGASVLQFSASKTNNQAASSFSAASPQMGPIQPQTGPTHSEIGPVHSQMVPSHSRMGPSHTPMGPTQAQINSLNAIKSAFGSQKMVLIDKDMGQVQIQPGSFTDRVVIRDPSRAISYSQPYSVSHRKLTPWQQPPSTLPPPMPAKTLPKVTIITPPPVKPRFQFTIADGLKVQRGNAQGAGGRGAHPPAANHGPPPGPIYPVNRGQAAPTQPRYNPPPPQWNQPPPQNQWNRPPPQQFYQNHPPTHPPRYLPPPTHPPRHYYPPPRRARPTPAPYVPPKTTRPTTTTTTTTKKPEIEYDIEGPPRTTQAPPPTRTRPTARPKCDYWSMDPFGNLQFYPCQRPVFRPPTTTPAPAPMFYFYDVPTPDPWKWYDYPNEVKIEVKVERDKRTK